MTVFSRKTNRVRDRGRCTYEVELLGKQRITTGVGQYNAYIVRCRRKIELKLADVEVTIFTAYVPGIGQVAERQVQILRPLGLFPIPSEEETRLTR